MERAPVGRESRHDDRRRLAVRLIGELCRSTLSTRVFDHSYLCRLSEYSTGIFSRSSRTVLLSAHVSVRKSRHWFCVVEIFLPEDSRRLAEALAPHRLVFVT